MIPEAIIERKYETHVDSDGRKVRQRDVNRSPNVTDRLEEYIENHNDSLPEESPERLLWFSDKLTNRQRQKRAKNVIRVKLGKHLSTEFLNGSITFNVCQLEHSKQIEDCIEEILAVPVMSVYAQTERSWAVRRMMEDMFSNRRRTYLKKLKASTRQCHSDECEITAKDSVPEPTHTEHEQEMKPMTDELAATAAAEAYKKLEGEKNCENESEVSQVSSESTENSKDCDEIDEQIERLKRKKRRLQDRKKVTKDANTHSGVDPVFVKRVKKGNKKEGGSKNARARKK